MKIHLMSNMTPKSSTWSVRKIIVIIMVIKIDYISPASRRMNISFLNFEAHAIFETSVFVPHKYRVTNIQDPLLTLLRDTF
jgi:hypothetical protein